MSKDMGVPPSGSGHQPTASAAEEASSQSGVPNAVSLSLLLADCRQALFDEIKADGGAGNATRYEIGRAIGLMGRAMDVVSEAASLVARIDDLDWCDFDNLTRDWNGHVDPPLCRLRKALGK